jgi:hypothetical protein
MLARISEYYTKNPQKLRSHLLLFGGIFIALEAQFTLFIAYGQPEFWSVNAWWKNFGANNTPLDGLILYALAGTLFVIGLHYSPDLSEKFTVPFVVEEKRNPRFGFWTTSIGLAIITAYFSSKATPLTNPMGFGIVTFLSIYLFSLSIYFDKHLRLPSKIKTLAWLKTHRAELFVIFTILVAAFLIRFLNLELLPYSFINDEGEMGRNGICLVLGSCLKIMETAWSQQPMLAFLPTGLSVWLLGNSALAVRLVSVTIGTLAVLAAYLFVREVFDKKIAWVAAMFLAALPVHVHFSRIGVDNIIDSLSTTFILWLIYRGIKGSSIFYFLLAGIIGGLCFYTYPGTRLAPVISLVVLLYISIYSRRFWKFHGGKFLVFIIGLLIVSAPIVGFFSTHTEVFAARMDRVGIFQTDLFQIKASSEGNSAISYLTEQFLKSSLVFIVSGAPSNFFNSPRPYLVSIAAIFFMLGLAYSIWRIKDPRYFTLMVWFWAAIILGSTITDSPPSSQRMLMSMPALSIIIALGLTKFTENIPRIGRFGHWFEPVVLLGFILLTGSQNINFYFSEYRSGHYFEDITNEFSYETRRQITPLHNSGRLFLMAEPHIPYLAFANLKFFSPDVEKAYLNDVTPQALAGLPNEKDALFIASSSRENEIRSIASLIPGGDWEEFHRIEHPEDILFFSYKIDKDLLKNFIP